MPKKMGLRLLPTIRKDEWSRNIKINAEFKIILGIRLYYTYVKENVCNVIDRICSLKWSVSRLEDDRWTKKILIWRQRAWNRTRFRSTIRWTDNVKRVTTGSYRYKKSQSGETMWRPK